MLTLHSFLFDAFARELILSIPRVHGHQILPRKEIIPPSRLHHKYNVIEQEKICIVKK